MDNTRNLLYSIVYYVKDASKLFDPNSISDSIVTIFDLGETGKEFKKIGDISQTIIKERFNALNQSVRKELNFTILDIYPITRKDSKYFNLVIITKNGLRAYIALDTYYSSKRIENEEQILEKDANKIYRYRPQMKYSMIIRQIAEPSNATIIEESEGDRAMKALQKHLIFNQIYYLEKRYFIFYKDEFKNRSYIDMIEFEENNLIRQDHTNILMGEVKNKEVISNVLKFDIKKEIYNIQKLPSTGIYDLNNLLKNIDYENNMPANINFLDSNEHYSYSSMHLFANQMFYAPEEYLVMTSSELIYLSKLRPIDTLYTILNTLDHTGTSNDYIYFINEYGLCEAAAMLLNIMCNKNMIFYQKVEQTVHHPVDEVNINISNILLMDNTEIKNTDKIMDIATNQFVKLIEYTLRDMNKGDGMKMDPGSSSRESRGMSKLQINIGQPITDVQSSKINCNIFFVIYSYFICDVYVLGKNCKVILGGESVYTYW